MVRLVRRSGRVVFRRGPPDFFQVLFNSPLIELLRIPLDDGDGIPGAVAETGAESVAEVVCGQPGLAVNDGNGPFGARGDAEPASVAFFFVNLNNFPDHVISLVWLLLGIGGMRPV
jgi:hypothetical protein